VVALPQEIVRRLGAIVLSPISAAPRTPDMALLLWVSLSLFAGAGLLVIHTLMMRRRRQWARVERAGHAPLRITPESGPYVVGVFAPEVVIPEWVHALSPTDRALILAHEDAHIAAHDPLLLCTAALGVVCMPWHPAMWWMYRRLRLAIELDCDQRLLRAGVAADRYGNLLLTAAQYRQQPPQGPHHWSPAFAARPSHLERRLLAMTTRRTAPQRRVSVAAGALGLVLVLAACESALPTAADIETMTAKSATTALTRLPLAATASDSIGTQYFVDGKPVAEAEAQLLKEQQIASVNVRLGSHTNFREIRIVSRAAAASSGPATASAPTDGPGASAPVPLMRSTAKPLLIVDGVLQADDAALNSIRPETIEMVEVLKGDVAKANYSDPRAANGVVIVKTKKPGAK
jgi:beta-lactamase regulating signal transducer with metallopeptidase domain